MTAPLNTEEMAEAVAACEEEGADQFSLIDLVPRLLATVGDRDRVIEELRAEVERLTRERDEAQAYLDRARAGTINYRDAYLAYQDWVASRSGRLGSLASSDAAYRATLDAALEIDEPAEEPMRDSIEAVDGIDEVTHCECCGLALAVGDPVAVFWTGADNSDLAIMHWGPCPEPDLWEVRYDLVNGHPHWGRSITARGPDSLPIREPYEDARNIARNIAFRFAADRGVERIRLIRIRRGATP